MPATSKIIRTRWRRGLVLPAALVGLFATVLLGAGPARAGTGCTLRYYYAFFGSSTWNPEQVDLYEPVSCYAPPTIVRTSFGSEIGAITNDAAHFYGFGEADSSPGWWLTSSMNGPVGYFGAPSATPYVGGTEFAVPAGGALDYVAVPDSFIGMLSPVAVTKSGLGSLAPAMTRTYGSTEIAATGAGNSLWFYWNNDGSNTWGPDQVAGTYMAWGSPAIVADNSSTEVAATSFDGSLWFYWIINGTSTWHPERATGAGAVSGSPAMTESGGAIEIAAAAPDGSLWFYWAANGSGTWYPEQVAGPGTTWTSPAMVASADSIEVTAAGP
jgi:hypothetical protein